MSIILMEYVLAICDQPLESHLHYYDTKGDRHPGI